MTKKTRTLIPIEVAAEALFLSDRTCCVCNIRGKQVQIHHIDENPSNNAIDNLSILCFDCHSQTMIKGGFGRKLEENQIIKYRDEWQKRVEKRKTNADNIASIQAVIGSTETMNVTDETDDEFSDYKTYSDPKILKKYLDKILSIHQVQQIIAQTKWDTGVTATMNQGSYDMVDFYEEVLIELSTFYPKGHFNNYLPKKYFSEFISSRFRWHRLILEPLGSGTGGRIVSTMTGGNVMEDLKKMIDDMVSSLLMAYNIDEQVDLNFWRKEWNK